MALALTLTRTLILILTRTLTLTLTLTLALTLTPTLTLTLTLTLTHEEEASPQHPGYPPSHEGIAYLAQQQYLVPPPQPLTNPCPNLTRAPNPTPTPAL